MSAIRFTGNAAIIAQVDKFTPANVEVGDIFILTITGWDGSSTAISFVATAATVANVTAGLTAAWNASTHALCTPITAADVTTYLTLTADVAGDAFSVAASTINGGSTNDQTLTKAAVAASSGPKHWDIAGNWDGGAVPGGSAGQDVYLADWSGDILYGLDQSGIANALASLNRDQSFTGKIGVNGSAGKSGTYLKIKTAALNLGQHVGSGSPVGPGREMYDLGSTACIVTIDNAGSPYDPNKPAIRILASSASTVIYAKKGKIGIAVEAGETSTISALNESYLQGITTDAEVTIGSGVTITTITKTGGALNLAAAVTTLTQYAGSTVTSGSGAITTANFTGGTATLNSTGTVSSLNVSNSAIVDMTLSRAARTVTTPKIDPGGTLKYDPAVVILTNKIAPILTAGNIAVSMAAA